MITLFSGTGMQERGFENSELYNLNIIGTSEIDADVTLSYAAVHNGLTKEMLDTYDYPPFEEMATYLADRKIGWDFQKNKGKDWFAMNTPKKIKEVEKYYLASVLQNNYGDISSIKELPYADFWFYSSCCQDLSVAGKMKGMTKGSGTRSGLLWEVERLLEKAVENGNQPKYLCLENVKNMVGKKFKPDFDLWIMRLEELGYNTYYKVLNGKECGIPQNRERIFALSIRKDVDTKSFEFPIPFDNGLRLKDILESDVDEKYYINTERAENLIQQLIDKGALSGERDCANSTIFEPNTRDISNCITARYDAGIQNKKSIGLVVYEPQDKDTPIKLGNVYNENFTGGSYAGNVWGKEGVSPALNTMQGGGRQPHIVDDLYANREPRVYDKAAPTLRCNCGMLKTVENDNKPICVGNTTPSGKSQCNAVYDPSGVSQTLCAGTHGYATGNIVHNYRIRKLTPRECWLLMGLTKEDCDNAASLGISNSALYKIAGNGIITNCIELIAEHLYKAQYNNTYVCYDENFTQPQAD